MPIPVISPHTPHIGGLLPHKAQPQHLDPISLSLSSNGRFPFLARIGNAGIFFPFFLFLYIYIFFLAVDPGSHLAAEVRGGGRLLGSGSCGDAGKAVTAAAAAGSGAAVAMRGAPGGLAELSRGAQPSGLH